MKTNKYDAFIKFKRYFIGKPIILYIYSEMLKNYNHILLIIFIILSFGCNNNSFKSGPNNSAATGWQINQDGGFKLNNKFKDQVTAPGMIFIQGGTFVKGNAKDNVMHDWNNTPTQQYVRSFFMDETEVTNGMYIEYLFWLKSMYGKNEETRKIYEAALPDTLVWRNPLGFNEDMVNNYLRHPAFRNHPVVGVSWLQATKFANWRTQRVNALILAEKGFLSKDSVLNNPNSKLNFNTKLYLSDPREAFGENFENYLGDKASEEEDGDNLPGIEEGILLPAYRLPTETEWEYAALGLDELREANLYRGKKKFPWNGEYTRSTRKKNLGDQLANFKLGKGDYGGIANWAEVDGSGITTSVRAYPANSFGLYGMGGNVAEWVADVYRPIIDEEANDFNYYRGNIYTKSSIGEDGISVIDNSNFQDDDNVRKLPNGRLDFKSLPGEIIESDLDSSELLRTNYSKSDNRDYNDGDKESSRNYGTNQQAKEMYNNPRNNNSDIADFRPSLIGNDSRVYKGGSWLDRSYYLDPAQRRFLPDYMTSNSIGFRCAMSYLGEGRNVTKPKKR